MESRAVDRLFNLLSSPSAYLRNESIDHLVQLVEENASANLGRFLDKIRRSVLKNPEMSWETRIAASKCVEKLFSSNSINEKYPEKLFETKIKSTNLNFDLEKTLNSGLILAASSFSADENFHVNDAALAEQRRKFDQQLLNNVPGFQLDTSDWISDADFDCQKMKNEHDIDHPAKVSKLIFQPNVDQLEKILISSSNFGEIFRTFYDLVLNDLLNARWTIRHASSLQLKILCKFLYKFLENVDDLSSILNRTLKNLLICISCDNFNDFVDGSKVVAPVRETVAQVFALCAALCDFESFGSNIVNICRQFFRHFDDSKWKTLHSGLLLAKYLLPTIFARNLSSLPDNFENFLVDICNCVSFENEDIINVCSETLAGSLEKIRQKYSNLTGNLAESCWKMLEKSFDPLIDEWPGALLKIMHLLIEKRPDENLTPDRLSLICKFLTHDAPAKGKTFETAVSLLYRCAEKFGVESWSEPGTLHVLRCLYVRRLVVAPCVPSDPDPESESEISFKLWSLLLENQPKNLVLKPLASYFCQFLNFVMVADHYPLLDAAIFSDLVILRREENGEFSSNKDEDWKFFLSGQDVINLKEEEAYFRISATKMEVCKYLAVWSRKTFTEKIALPDDEPDDDPNWLILVLSLNLKSNSSIRRTIIYMIILQWSKLLSIDEQFPTNLYFEDFNSENWQVFDEILPLLAQINVQKTNLSNFLTGKMNLERILEFPDFLNFYFSDISHVTLLKNRIFQRKDAFFEEIKKIKTTVIDVQNLEISLTEIETTCDKILRQELILKAWRVLCVWRQIFLKMKILPPKLSNLVSPLMKIVKNEVKSPILNFFCPLVQEISTTIQILLGKFFNSDEKFLQLKEKLITNLIFIHVGPKIEQFKKENKSILVIDYENLIQNLQYDEHDDYFSKMVENSNENDASKMSGEILSKICQNSSPSTKYLSANFPTLVNVLNFLASAEGEERQNDIVAALQLASTLLPKLQVDFRLQLLEKISPNLSGKFLISKSNFIRNSTCRLISIVAEIDRKIFVDRILDDVLNLLIKDEQKSPDSNVLMGVLELILTIFRRKLQISGFATLVALPCLGLMSHKNECIRSIAATCFSVAVKLMPLEINLHSNLEYLADLSANLRQKLENQRQFSSLLTNPESLMKNFQFKMKNDDSATADVVDLRPYQKEGVCWLIFLRKFQLNGILGDDMGLGKTLQTLCCLADFYASEASPDRKTGRPSLIVCPKTLVEHWRCETEKFFDQKSLKCKIFDNIDEISRYSKKEDLNDDDYATLAVVSYDTLRRRSDFFTSKHWAYCVLDEGHVIRNWKSSTYQAIIQLKAKHRLILSGTPIQNNLLELWSLFEFLMPGYLGDRRQFNKLYNKILSAECKQQSQKSVQNDDSTSVDCKLLESSRRTLHSLHKLILPFILRRRKCDVLRELPPKIVQNIFCPLSTLQRLLYRDFADSLQNTKNKMTSSSPLHILTYLRKLCDHPCLILDGKDAELNFDRYLETAAVDHPDVEFLTDYRLSGKMIALMQLLADCGILRSKIEGDFDGRTPTTMTTTTPPHRALIFCQFKSVVDLICSYFDDSPADVSKNSTLNVSGKNGIVSYLRLDGTVTPVERQNVARKFNDENSNVDVLILTTSIGGLGLNLTGADVVIFVDHDWNPAKDLQAMDRAHRIGQRRTVNVYRLICKETLEEKILRCQSLKLDVSQTVICDQNRSINSMNTDQLLDLLCDDEEDEKKINFDQSSSSSKKKETFNMAAMEKLWDQSQKEYDEAFDVKCFVKNI